MFEILEKQNLAEGIWLMKIHAPRVARSAQPGQFVIVRTDETGERIPLTISDYDPEQGSVTIVTQALGVSTRKICALEAGDSLADFIEWVRLRTDLDTVTEDGQAVTLMTVHSSKGLEFDCVWVAGMEETLFPHSNSTMDASAVEEERRLAYVAITRARKKLYLTCAQQRQIFGQTHAKPVSRFIGEIPSELRQTTGLGSAGFSGSAGCRGTSLPGMGRSGLSRCPLR